MLKNDILRQYETCSNQPGKRNVENICENSLPFFLCNLYSRRFFKLKKYTFFQLNRQIGYRFPSQKKTRSYERKKVEGIRSSHMYLNYL